MVVPARSLPVSAVEAASEEAASAEEAADSETEAVEPQAARLRASAPARVTEISFFIILVSPFFVLVVFFPDRADPSFCRHIRTPGCLYTGPRSMTKFLLFR